MNLTRIDVSVINVAMILAEQIATNPDPMEPFHISQDSRMNGLVVMAALNEHGEIVGEGNFELQAKQTFKNLQAVLDAGGSSLEHVVNVTIYLTDMSYFPQIVELREKYFTKLPSRHDR